MVADDAGLVGVRERPEPGERLRRIVLVEAPERRGDLRVDALGVGRGRAREGLPGGDRPARPAGARCRRRAARRRRPPRPGARSSASCSSGESPSSPGGASSGATNGGRPGANCGLRRSSARSAAGVSGSTSPTCAQALRAPSSSPLASRARPEVEPDDAALRLLGGERLQALHRAFRPGRDRRADGGFHRLRILREDLLEAGEAAGPVALVDQRLRLPESVGLGVAPDGEAQLERRRRRSASASRPARSRPRPGGRRRRRPARRRRPPPGRRGRGRDAETRGERSFRPLPDGA